LFLRGVFFDLWWSGVFAGVFGKKRCAERGFLMVNSWWIAGKSWWVDGHFLPSKIFLFFQLYFSPDRGCSESARFGTAAPAC
jgi:hypothetical protein